MFASLSILVSFGYDAVFSLPSSGHTVVEVLPAGRRYVLAQLRAGGAQEAHEALLKKGQALLISNSLPLNAVASQMGHASTATTSKIYIHELQSAQVAAAEALDAIIGTRK